PIEGYNRQLRKVTKTKAAFPTYEAVRKVLWLAHQNIAKKWTMPVQQISDNYMCLPRKTDETFNFYLFIRVTCFCR
ncbi:MAG: hypothetical protein K8I82_05420, partial [Anaerolineae bacterium]|nr:hypothetical protein [Anaerolineae bacterium]